MLEVHLGNSFNILTLNLLYPDTSFKSPDNEFEGNFFRKKMW